MQFEFTENGLKSLKNLDHTIAKRILKKIKYWQNTNNPLNFSKSIKESMGLFRYRVGDWRIIVSPDFKKDTVDILKIDHRSTVYKNVDNL